ncbi:MAG: hypothetical protein WD009_05070 [Phycisphaeraceae bacterium]
MSRELYGHPIHAFWARLFGGLVGPLILIVVGVACISTGRAWIPGRFGGTSLDGTGAIALGVAALGAALALHLHRVWRPAAHNYWKFIYLGIWLGTVAFGGGLLVATWYAFRDAII